MLKVVLSLFLTLILYSVGVGQERVIKGTVTDVSGASIPNASILAAGAGESHRTQTNCDGQYELKLPAGKYDLEFQAKAFRPVRVVGLSTADVQSSEIEMVVRLDVDLESPTSIFTEFVCDKNGECKTVSRMGNGGTKPKEFKFKYTKKKRITYN